jgi:hypothetical protein
MQQKLESDNVTAQASKTNAVLKQIQLNPISANETNSTNQVKVKLAGPSMISSHRSPMPVSTKAQMLHKHESRSLPKQQQLIHYEVHNTKFVGEQESIAAALQQYTGEIDTAAISKMLRSTDEVLQHLLNLVHKIAGQVYKDINFQLQQEVVYKHKSFEELRANPNKTMYAPDPG